MRHTSIYSERKEMKISAPYLRMKRMLKLALISGAFLTGISYFALRANRRSPVTDLAFENIEALAQDEGGAMVICLGSGEVDCRGIKVEVKYTGLR